MIVTEEKTLKYELSQNYCATQENDELRIDRYNIENVILHTYCIHICVDTYLFKIKLWLFNCWCWIITAIVMHITSHNHDISLKKTHTFWTIFSTFFQKIGTKTQGPPPPAALDQKSWGFNSIRVMSRSEPRTRESCNVLLMGKTHPKIQVGIGPWGFNEI